MEKKVYPKILEEGTRFEKLSVICIDESSKYKNGKERKKSDWKYVCKCDCGRTHSVCRGSLLQGVTTMCPFCSTLKYHRYLQMGDKYNRLTIIGVDGNSMFNKKGEMKLPSKWKYLCQCECGKIKSICRPSLINEVTISCGCYKTERTIEACKKYNKIETIGDISLLYFKG